MPFNMIGGAKNRMKQFGQQRPQQAMGAPSPNVVDRFSNTGFPGPGATLPGGGMTMGAPVDRFQNTGFVPPPAGGGPMQEGKIGGFTNTGFFPPAPGGLPNTKMNPMEMPTGGMNFAQAGGPSQSLIQQLLQRRMQFGG